MRVDVGEARTAEHGGVPSCGWSGWKEWVQWMGFGVDGVSGGDGFDGKGRW